MLFLMVFERFPEKFSLGIPPNHGSVNMLFLMVFERFPEKFSLGISPPPLQPDYRSNITISYYVICVTNKSVMTFFLSINICLSVLLFA